MQAFYLEFKIGACKRVWKRKKVKQRNLAVQSEWAAVETLTQWPWEVWSLGEAGPKGEVTRCWTWGGGHLPVIFGQINGGNELGSTQSLHQVVNPGEGITVEPRDLVEIESCCPVWVPSCFRTMTVELNQGLADSSMILSISIFSIASLIAFWWASRNPVWPKFDHYFGGVLILWWTMCMSLEVKNWSTNSIISWCCDWVQSAPNLTKVHSGGSGEQEAWGDTTGADTTHFFNRLTIHNWVSARLPGCCIQ